MRSRRLDWLVNVFVAAGMATICGGLSMIYLPLGVISLGVCWILIAVAITRLTRGKPDHGTDSGRSRKTD